jgi:hypothetical protein
MYGAAISSCLLTATEAEPAFHHPVHLTAADEVHQKHLGLDDACLQAPQPGSSIAPAQLPRQIVDS